MHGVILPLTIVRKRVNYFPVSLDHLRLLFNRLRMLPKGQLHSPRAPPGTSQGTQFRSFSSVPRPLRPMFRADFRSVRCFRSLGSLSTLQCAPFCPLSGRQDAEFQPGPLGRRIPSGGGFSPSSSRVKGSYPHRYLSLDPIETSAQTVRRGGVARSGCVHEDREAQAEGGGSPRGSPRVPSAEYPRGIFFFWEGMHGCDRRHGDSIACGYERRESGSHLGERGGSKQQRVVTGRWEASLARQAVAGVHAGGGIGTGRLGAQLLVHVLSQHHVRPVAPFKLDARQIGRVHERTLQHRVGEVRSLEVSLLEVGQAQVRTLKRRTLGETGEKRHSRQVRTVELGLLQH